MCQPHWEKLRAAIDERGLGHLVAQGGEEAMRRQVAELEGGRSADTFEPLLGAHWAIVNNVMDVMGLAVMAPNEDGTDRCPLCYLNSEHAAHCDDPACTIVDFDDWIEKAADGQLEAWKQLSGEPLQ